MRATAPHLAESAVITAAACAGVLPTTVWLELSVGNLEAAVSVSLLMVLMAILVLVIVRRTGEKV